MAPPLDDGPPLVVAVLLTRDEHDLIDDWIDFYGAMYGPTNLMIVDNGSQDARALHAYERAKAMGVEVRVDRRPFRDATVWMTEHLRAAAARVPAPTFLAPLETDEFVFMADDPSGPLTRERVHAALRAVPDDVSIVRYGAFWGSVPRESDAGYVPGAGYTRPAAQITSFANQGWDKLIIRASQFDRCLQWCHHAAVHGGRTATCDALGLLHLHDTGFARQVDKSLAVMESFKYVDTRASIDAQLAQCARVAEAGVACGHKVEYYSTYLRRRAVVQAFRDAGLGRLPTPDEVATYAAADPAMRAGGPAAAVRRDLKRLRAGPSPTSSATVAPDEWRMRVYAELPRAADAPPIVEVTQVADFLASLEEHDEVPEPEERPDPTLMKTTPQAPPTEAVEPPTFEAALTRYAAAHNQDGTDKVSSHAYGPLYSDVLGPYRDTARRVLEIGVYSGASVLAMADFFHRAHVVGLDITLSNVKFGRGHPRITLRQLDGVSLDAPRLVGGGGAGWDVVLDDASHRRADQIEAFRVWGPLVAPGGVYIIEDIDGREDDAKPLREALAAESARLGYEPLEWHDLRPVKGQFDDIVAVMRRKAAA